MILRQVAKTKSKKSKKSKKCGCCKCPKPQKVFVKFCPVPIPIIAGGSSGGSGGSGGQYNSSGFFFRIMYFKFRFQNLT